MSKGNKLPDGTKVVIRDNSGYISQQPLFQGKKVVGEIKFYKGDGWWKVDFGKYDNSYRFEDLEIISDNNYEIY